MNSITRISLGLAMLGCAVALAACGGTGTSAATTTGARGTASGIKFANCMRSHGVPNFPDPSPNGTVAINGFDPQSPSVQSAQTTCIKLRGGGGSPPQVSAAHKARLIAISKCMRTHGVPNFPDPTFPTGGGAHIRVGGPGLNLRSPAFQKAAAECGAPGRRPGGIAVVPAS
ncbi:MAG TPA: hypothetical protein VG223_04240 [Solirubrobacteraceae bacterium]|jgi:hypothetical protein|nr:hypothetical protein [Solirubrobacteraceae bacterium]